MRVPVEGQVDARLLAFGAVSVLLICTPGPDTALVIRNALRGGRHAASMTAFGVAAGTVVWVAAAGLGVAALLETSAVAFTFLKLAGGAYLVWLGLTALFRPRAEPEAKPNSSRPGAGSPLGQGLVSNLLNAKTGAFFLTVMPQFLVPGDSGWRLLAMLVVFETLLLGWLNLYGLMVSRVGRGPVGVRVSRVASRITGVVLIGLGLRLALERR